MAWHLDEQIKPFPGGEIGLVAVVGDLDAAHQFHDEEGPARVGRAGVEHPGDIGVVHHRERLPLRLKPGDHLLGVHAQLDDLERHAPAHGYCLLGHINHATSPFAHTFQQLVTPEGLAHRLVGSVSGVKLEGRLSGFDIGGQRRFRFVMRGEQGFEAGAQGGIGSAHGQQKGRTLRQRLFDGQCEQRGLTFLGRWHG